MPLTGRVTWSSKPPIGVQPNRSHPLLRGLLDLYPLQEGAGGSASNLARPVKTTVSGTPLWAASAAGSGFKGDGTARRLIATGHKLTTFTHLVVFVPQAVGAVNCIMGISESGDTTTADRGMYLTATNLPSFHVFDGADKVVSGTTAGRVGVPLVLVATADGTNIRMYVNGNLEGTTAASAAYTGYTTPVLTIGMGATNAANTQYATGVISLVATWSRLLSSSEIRQIGANPWILFQPPQRLWVKGAAGGTAFTQALSGATASAGALVKATSKGLAGSSASSGVAAKLVARILSGASASAGVLVKQPQKLLSGASASAGVLVKTTGKVLSGASTSAGTLARAAGKVLSSSSASTGTLAKQAAKQFTGATASSGALVKQAQKVLSGTTTTTGSIRRAVSTSLSGATATAGSLAKLVTKRLTGASTSSGALVAIRAFLLSLSGSTASAGTLVKQAGKSLAGATASSSTVTKAISHALSGATASTGSATTGATAPPIEPPVIVAGGGYIRPQPARSTPWTFGQPRTSITTARGQGHAMAATGHGHASALPPRATASGHAVALGAQGTGLAHGTAVMHGRGTARGTPASATGRGWTWPLEDELTLLGLEEWIDDESLVLA